MKRLLLAALLASAFAATGCVPDNARFVTEERKARGLVVILPGIEGPSPLNRNIRQGLDEAGISQALAIEPWGRPVPGLGPLINQMDFLGNRLAASRLARVIAAYQDQYPDRPVHIVGHSGGGGIAVFIAEAMPAGHKVDGLVLLDASISRDYDLSRALANVRQGIVNFYNPGDSLLLGLGTLVTSNVDGIRGPSAGLKGFTKSFSRLYQIEVAGAEAETDPHTAATMPGFVRAYVAPWIRSNQWPAYSGAMVDLKPACLARNGESAAAHVGPG